MALASIDDASAYAETREALRGLCTALRAAPRTAAPPRESAALAAWADEGEAAVWACVAAS